MTELVILFDLKDPLSYLALEPFRELALEAGAASWYPFLGRALPAPSEPAADADRGAWHRWHRARYREQDLRRYARARGLAARRFFDAGLYRQTSAEVAAYGFNWAQRGGDDAGQAYLSRVFPAYWDADLDPDSVASIGDVLAAAGLSTDGFDDYCRSEAAAELAAQREELVALGAFATPSCLLDGESFLGRQHLPYLRARLKGRR